MQLIYVKTTLTVPGAGAVIHYAELEPIPETQLCRPHRMMEANPAEQVTGIFQREPQRLEGMATMPQQLIPHPDSWSSMPDITSEHVTAEAFEQLWASYPLGR